MINSLGWQTVVATPPITTQGLSTVCPPVTDVPASSDASLNPWMINGMTLSLSCKDTRESDQTDRAKCNIKYLYINVLLQHLHNRFSVDICQTEDLKVYQHTSLTFSDILLLTPRSINMLSQSVTPMAYRSLKTLAHAIRPYQTEIQKWSNKRLAYAIVRLPHVTALVKVVLPKKRGDPYHHVWVINNGVDVICSLDQRKASVSERDHTGVHAYAFTY